MRECAHKDECFQSLFVTHLLDLLSALSPPSVASVVVLWLRNDDDDDDDHDGGDGDVGEGSSIMPLFV